MIFILHSINVCITLIDLYWTILGYKGEISLVCESFNAVLKLICQDFVENFHICIHQGYRSIVFFQCPCLVLTSRWCWPCKMNTTAVFAKSLGMTGVISSLNVWWNSPVKASGPALFFVRSFDCWFSIFICYWSVPVFHFSILQSWLVNIRKRSPVCRYYPRPCSPRRWPRGAGIRLLVPRLVLRSVCLLSNSQAGEAPPGASGVWWWIPQLPQGTFAHEQVPDFSCWSEGTKIRNGRPPWWRSG